MTSPTLSRIRRMQREMPLLSDLAPPEHAPEMLLIGCVDARLAIQDIGIPYGKALIFRDIAALIAGENSEGGEHLSEAAMLEFAVNIMQVKDIVVMGHTDCGGIRAALADDKSPETAYIRRYLSPLFPIREEVLNSGGNGEQQARIMEQAAVAQSVENLSTYEAVARAVSEERLALHGWVIDTATRAISELCDDGIFRPMRIAKAG